MTDPTPDTLDAALERLDFAAARALAAATERPERDEMQARIQEALDDAEERAELLAGRIQSMARADHYEGLLSLAEDPATDRLLHLLTPEIRRGANLHLEGARKRQQRFQDAARRHMNAASDALVLLDTTRARAELDRVDRRWLDEDQRTTLDDLLAQTEEAAAERRELDARTAEVLREAHPSQGAGQGLGQAGARRSVRSGCLGSALAVAAACGANFVRVNVLCGARLTDQGIINGIAHDSISKHKHNE